MSHDQTELNWIPVKGDVLSPSSIGWREGEGGGRGQWKGEFFMGEGVLAGTRGKGMTKKETKRVGRGEEAM